MGRALVRWFLIPRRRLGASAGLRRFFLAGNRRQRVPQIRPFAGIHFSKSVGTDFSNLIAPPFDVLDEKKKAALQARHPNNIVTIDLPYLPPKAVGPDAVYEKANTT